MTKSRRRTGRAGHPSSRRDDRRAVQAAPQQIEGRQPVCEALRGQRRVHRVWVAEQARGEAVRELIRLAEARGVPLERVPRQTLEQHALTTQHQGVIAWTEPFRYVPLETLLERARRVGEDPLLLVCAEIQDPRNVGSLIRSAEAAGVHGVIVPKHRSAGYSPAMIHASAGAVEYLPLAQVTNLVQAIKELKQHGLWVCAADAAASQTYDEAPLDGPLAIVVGSEGRGVPPLVRRHCDFGVAIPMAGRITSLNAAVAGALLMFEAARRRRRRHSVDNA